MEAGELADRYEKDEVVLLDREMARLRNKCVRFAADMEALTKVSTVRFMESRTKEIICICALWNGTFEIRGDGSDIYSAARAAVEALKGEGSDEVSSSDERS